MCSTLRTPALAVVCDLVQASTQERLLAQFAHLAIRGMKYDVVLVVGHSNRNVLALASNAVCTWSVVAQWIDPFQPRLIVLAGCEAARWLPSAALFAGIKTLREIYGTPVASTEAQLQVLRLFLAYLFAGGKVGRDLRLLSQTLNYALTGGIIFRQTRAEMEAHGPREAAIWTGLEDILSKLRPSV